MEAMTVDQLIEELKILSDQGKGQLPVHFTYNYGDHWKTRVAAIVETVEEGEIIHSDYHNMDKVLERDDDEYDSEIPDAHDAILLS